MKRQMWVKIFCAQIMRRVVPNFRHVAFFKKINMVSILICKFEQIKKQYLNKKLKFIKDVVLCHMYKINVKCLNKTKKKFTNLCINKKAECCDDKIHCCPKGYICNPSQGKCDKNKTMSGESDSISWSKKIKGKKINKVKEDCPDGESQCAAGTTCCLTSSGEYGKITNIVIKLKAKMKKYSTKFKRMLPIT